MSPAQPDQQSLEPPIALAAEPAIFEELFRRFQRPLLVFFSRRTGDGGHAENLLQETFFKAFKYWTSYDRSRRVSSWLFSIAGNIYRDWLHAEATAKTAPLTEFADEAELADPEDAAVARDTRAALIRAVMDMPEKYRAVLLMKHYKRMKYTDIASELGLNEGTVKSRLNTAAGLLREKLRREGWFA